MADLDRMKEVNLFDGLTDEQLKGLLERGEKREAGEGEPVFAEGDGGHEVFVVLEGRVRITVKMSRESEQAPVHTVLPGHVFGEFAMVAEHERSATAVSTKDTVLFVFTRELFETLAEEDPKLGYIVLRNLGRIVVGRLIKTTRELRASLMF